MWVNAKEASEHFGMCQSTLRSRCERGTEGCALRRRDPAHPMRWQYWIGQHPPTTEDFLSATQPLPVEVTRPQPLPDEPIEEWIKARVRASRRKRAKHNPARLVTLPAEPMAIAIIGDPHVDNDGCDWSALHDHIKLLSEPGVLITCIGDMQDNWIGRLGKLYANSSSLASEGWKASEWLLSQGQWLAVVGGNHDAWSHVPGLDPLQWLCKQNGVKCYDPDELRLYLQWRDRPDLEALVIKLRHDFRGRSWFHPTHGPHKEALLDGEAHIFAAGHIHQWGELTSEHRRGRVTSAIRVRGYKKADGYAKRGGFPEQQHGESALVVVQPEIEGPGRCQIFWDLASGIKWLRHLRSG